MYRTDDPIADFNRWDKEQADWLAKLPRCAYCEEPIQQEDAVLLDDKWYCDDCLHKSRTTIEVDV